MGATCGTAGAVGAPLTLQAFECMFANILKVLLPALGILFFIMFLIGGFKYLTSGGDPKAIDSAHKTLTYAIGGLIVASLSYIILLVINFITGADVTNFLIYQP